MKTSILIAAIIQTVLVALKLSGIATNSWLTILMPMWLPCMVIGAPIALLLTYLIITE